MLEKENQAAWKDFNKGTWCSKIDVRDFILKNYTKYEGDDSFLVGPTEKTNNLWKKVALLMQDEMKKDGVLDADTKIISTITSHEAGYVDKDLEIIVGLQTDKPLKRAMMPNGRNKNCS